MERFGLVVPADADTRRKADAEAQARRNARRDAARQQAQAKAKANADLAKAKEGLRQSLSKLLYQALKES
jgi:membrane protein involved in colicin uptake